MQVPPIAESLVGWFTYHARVLPWRVEPSVYKTVVSEFMLQQTQVGTVIPYFEAWLRRFPDFETLALADNDAVLHAWSGLGYYNRARRLHSLAKILAAWTREGEIPKDEAAWQRLPGIGPYTAASITSIAFGTPVAVVDGNVVRVLARLVADATLFKSHTAAARHLKPLAQQLLSRSHAGTYNEAIMELGATVCTKYQPRCDACPLQRHCQAYALGVPLQYPRLVRKSTQSVVVDRALCVHQGRILLWRTPENATRLAGLYELPLLKTIAAESLHLVNVRNRAIAQERIRERLYATAVPDVIEAPLSWVNIQNLTQVPLSGPHRKWLQTLEF